MSQVPNATAATVLGFLLDGPRTGGELDQAIRSSVGEFWNVTRSQVYRELRRLADDELVTAAAPGPRASVPHEITAAGRGAFLDWLDQELPMESRRLPVLLTTYFGEHLRPGRLAELLHQHREANRRVLAHYRALEAVLQESPHALATVRFGLAYTEMVDRWIEDVGLPLASGAGPGAAPR